MGALCVCTPGVGGYVTTADRLVYPNDQLKVESELNETHWRYDKTALSADPAEADGEDQSSHPSAFIAAAEAQCARAVQGCMSSQG